MRAQSGRAWPKYNLIGFGDLLAQMANFLPRLTDLQALIGQGDRSELIRAFLGPHKDVGNLPPVVFAFAAEPPNILASLGMVDDMGDGTISVELRGLKASPESSRAAQLLTGPPPSSIARRWLGRPRRSRSGTKPQMDQDDRPSADAEVGDLLDRAYETAGLQNVDAVADFFREENRNRALRPDNPFTPQQAADLLWDRGKVTSVQTLPLTALALQRHRRNTADLFKFSAERPRAGSSDGCALPPTRRNSMTSACPG